MDVSIDTHAAYKKSLKKNDYRSKRLSSRAAAVLPPALTFYDNNRIISYEDLVMKVLGE